MIPEEAIKLEEIRNHLAMVLATNAYLNICESTDLIVAIDAIDRQIQKKPYKDNDNGVYEKDHCPTCHRSLFPYDHHCECGQAIDWSD